MKLITKEDIIKSVAQKYKNRYFRCGTFLAECHFGSARNHRAHYESLLKATTEAEITAILGNASWTRNVCSECGMDVDIRVQLGQDPDEEICTAFVCLSCLRGAVELIADNKRRQDDDEKRAAPTNSG